MNETTLKRKFKQLFIKENPSFKGFEEIIPKSLNTKSVGSKLKQVKWNQLHNKDIIAIYDNFANLVYILVKKDKYEIYVIDTLPKGHGIYGPVLYKML